MRLFRRKPVTGKHALGAAVTGIPSAPLRAPLPATRDLPPTARAVLPTEAAPAVLPPVPPASPAQPPAPASDWAVPAGSGQDLSADEVADLVALAPLLAPGLLSEIAALLATGEAWATDERAPQVVRPPASASVPPGGHTAPMPAVPTAAGPMAELPSAPPVEAGAMSADVDGAPAPWTYAVLGITPAPHETVPTAQPAAGVPAVALPAADVAGSAGDPATQPRPAPSAARAEQVSVPPAPGPTLSPTAIPAADQVVLSPSVPVASPVTQPASAPTPAPAPVSEPVPGGRSALAAALADLLPPAEPAATAPPTPARVQLGFRDGTSTALDPSSDQSQALQELARSLTRRD